MNTVYTVGHSTRSLEELIALLKAHGATRLVDIRTVPRSRRNPQFNTEALPAPLAEAGLGYTLLKALGGLRKGIGDASPNAGWRNASFRGYADYMQTGEFEAGLADLLRLAESETVAIMCAEAVPWRCHRSLVADALLVRAVPVRHIMSESRADPARLTPFAQVDGTQITYPPEQLPLPAE